MRASGWLERGRAWAHGSCATALSRHRPALFIALAPFGTLAKPSLIAKAGFTGCFIDYDVPGAIGCKVTLR